MHIKKKTGKGFLDSLQEKNSVKTIGVVGSCRGDGVTTLSIAMANYLAEIMSAKTAIVECNDTRALQIMGECIVGKENNEDIYEIGKVKYFSNINLDEFFAKYSESFEYVIVDFGCGFIKFNSNISRIKYKIILGSVMPYKLVYHEKIIGNSVCCDECLHLLSGDEKNVKEYSVKRKINALVRPVIVNPYIIESKLANFFQVLF